MNFDCTPEFSLRLNGLINDDNITWNSCLDGCRHVLPSVQAGFFFYSLGNHSCRRDRSAWSQLTPIWKMFAA